MNVQSSFRSIIFEILKKNHLNLIVSHQIKLKFVYYSPNKCQVSCQGGSSQKEGSSISS